MKSIFEEYSGVIITGVAIVALVAIVGVLLANGGPVSTAFHDLITSLLSKANLG